MPIRAKLKKGPMRFYYRDLQRDNIPPNYHYRLLVLPSTATEKFACRLHPCWVRVTGPSPTEYFLELEPQHAFRQERSQDHKKKRTTIENNNRNNINDFK